MLFQTADARTLTDEQLGGFGRDLIDQRDNQADPRVAAADVWGTPHLKGGAEWQPLRQLPRHALPATRSGFTTSSRTSTAARRQRRPASPAAAGRPAVQRLQRQRLQRADAHHRRACATARAFYTAVRHEPRRHDHRRPKLGRRWCSTARRQPARAASTTTATSSRRPARRRPELEGSQLLRPGRASLQPADAERRASAPSAGSISPRPATTSTRSPGNSRRASARRTTCWATAGRRCRLLGPLLRPDPQQHDQLRRHAHRFDPSKSRSTRALNKWVTYRTRGGPAVQDALFSPTTQTPYTDDLQFGYAVDLGNNMSFDGALLSTAGRATSSRTTTSSSTPTRTAIPVRSTTRTRCSWATTTSATRENPGVATSSSARWTAASATSRRRVRVPQALRQQLAERWRRTR